MRISHRSSLIKAALATILFGSAPACIRVVKLDSYALGIVRLSLAAAGMTAILAVARRGALGAIIAEVRREWRLLVAVGVFFGLHWLTYFESIKLASASIGALGFSTCGVQLPLLGWAFGFGRPTTAALTGVALAMLGSWLCLPASSGMGDGQLLGLAIGILSGTFYAVLPMLHQRYARLDHEIRTWAMFTFALPVFLAVAPAATWDFSWQDVWLILHLGLVINLIGHYLWVQVSTELPLTTTSVLGYLQLPAALAINALFINEPLTLGMAAGAACIVVGNLLALSGGESKNTAEGLGADRDGPIEDFPGDTSLPLTIDRQGGADR